ncbi:MAG: hypothetical protein ACOYI8_07740 [Christensenellales bacterium]
MHAIWLSEVNHPARQRCVTNIYGHGGEEHSYCVAEFEREYVFDAVPREVRLRVYGEAAFFLWANDAFIGCGPVSAGGDFLCKGALPWAFANHYSLTIEEKTLRIRALVRLTPLVLTEYTQGRGVFALTGEAEFDTGAKESFATDDSWRCRVKSEYVSSKNYDATRPSGEWEYAEKVSYPLEPLDAPIPMLEFQKVHPQSIRQDTVLFDRIYAAYPMLTADRACAVDVEMFEVQGQEPERQHIEFSGADTWHALRMYSIGGMRIQATNDARVEVALLSVRYPVGKMGLFETDDSGLHAVMDVCRWTLSICRQTIHLDGPRHQEMLACTGDYYIQMLMTLFENGDMRLADLDVRRTAMWLEVNDGRMFHTTYSLIWVQMLRKLYEISGNADTVLFCKGALMKLFARFQTYMGENGVIENPPDYMFVDWTVTKGYSMHHPPKSLGQTVLNAFYYKALSDACVLAKDCLKDDALYEKWSIQRDLLPEAFNRCFWDAEKRMYIDGLPTKEKNPNKWLPENPPLRHYSRYPQALAALYGLCALQYKKHLAALAADGTNGLPDLQPYFAHFVLESVIEAGIEDEYAMPLLRRWIPIALACSKGLQEGWIKPQEDYTFDYSHAWAGTPAYHLPLLLTGLKIESPGMQAISLRPQLMGLKRAVVSFHTPFGEVIVRQKEGKAPDISYPDGMSVKIRTF